MEITPAGHAGLPARCCFAAARGIGAGWWTYRRPAMVVTQRVARHRARLVRWWRCRHEMIICARVCSIAERGPTSPARHGGRKTYDGRRAVPSSRPCRCASAVLPRPNAAESRCGQGVAAPTRRACCRRRRARARTHAARPQVHRGFGRKLAPRWRCACDVVGVLGPGSTSWRRIRIAGARPAAPLR